jgi:phenylalanyl-tRNA synthetase beta chain
MKISYNWLKQYLHTSLTPEEAAALLTGGGLEVENTEVFESVKGGLEGLVVGEVKTKEKHPDADRLSITTVDAGGPALLQIVCGAANVAAGQKVIVALDGARLFPTEGEPFVIKKSKIRGQASEGMICAEDEIGLGKSHAGIMVLPADTPVGMPAKDYFKIEKDHVFEVGLTPNRADAASHTGVARDLLALILNQSSDASATTLTLPSVEAFHVGKPGLSISVEVLDAEACPRYSGVCISGVQVQDSPDWLKNKLKAIGLRPINNIVDITNYVLHELGQPLHAFDADKIKGSKVLVKKCADKTKFTTLDGVERELSSEDLMICHAEGPMCIAGVFGGAESGVTEKTRNIFLESAWFNAVSIRKSSRHHNLKTDASFRYERGTDPDVTVYALKRAALIICELAGGLVSSEITDIYPNPVQPFRIPFAFSNCDKLIGKKIDHDVIRNILKSLGIHIESDSNDALLLAVPPRKVDVTRECDVVEEILRIYGYNKVEIPQSVHSSISYSPRPDKVKVQRLISEQLSQNGFHEIICNSLTKGAYYKENASFDPGKSVELLNPLSSDLNVMRQAMLYGGLEVIAYNQNHKQPDLKLYEFGKTYMKGANGFYETMHLSLWMTGRKMAEGWNAKTESSDFYHLKAFVTGILSRLGLVVSSVSEVSDELFSASLMIECSKKKIAQLGILKKSVLKQADASGEVLYADLNWDNIIAALPKKDIEYKDVPKFPSVRRDLALVLDKKVRFHEVEQLAYQYEKGLLKGVNLFDVYEGEKLGAGKKSYAVSFTLQDENATLTDKQIEKIMEKLMKAYVEKLGAEIRQ